jgi:CRISPR/Cas system CSM-associated protein Csm2 small subunit
MADFDFIYVLGELPALKSIKDELRKMPSFSTASSDVKEHFHLFAATLAQSMGTDVTPTQLRRFYTYIKSMELSNRSKKPDDTDIIDKYKLYFILPKIAGSSKKEKLSLLYEIFGLCLDHKAPKIKNVLDLRLFVEFFEAILDYHASLPKKVSNSNRETDNE